jgi:hypothetical protein
MRPRFLRYWRIAFSAGCGLAAVLLMLLWVRSCWTCDSVIIPFSNSWRVGFGSLPGSCGVEISKINVYVLRWNTNEVDVISRSMPKPYSKFYTGIWGRFAYINSAGPGILIPDWFLIGVAVALSAAPWIRWSNRFSLRTLVITTTLVAVVLGLIVWSINR